MHIFTEVCGFIVVLVVITYLVFRYHDEIDKALTWFYKFARRGRTL